jgi:chaperonin cofactor prefoldin
MIPTEILSNPAIAGPGGFMLALVFWLGKLYLDNRKERRDDLSSKGDSESKIVQTTDSLAQLMRRHMEEMNRDLEKERETRRTLEAKVDRLQEENAKLRSRVEQLEDEVSKQQASQTSYGTDAYSGYRQPYESGPSPNRRRDSSGNLPSGARRPDRSAESTNPTGIGS